MLHENREKSLGLAARGRQFLRALALLLMGAVLVSFVAYAIWNFDAGGRSRVYADSSVSEAGSSDPEVQVGLMGVVNGVANMERYSDATRMISVADSEEKVLAGASGIDRRAVRRDSFQKATRKAGELGYYAQLALEDSQKMTSADYYTLLQIVEAEATGGDVMSKMMVAGVVMNRVADSHFPDTIYDVVWQNGQFQPTWDGRIFSCTISDTTFEAVRRVLAGEDYSDGALFFVARSSADASKLSWFDSSLAWLYDYGGHDYYTFQEYVS